MLLGTYQLRTRYLYFIFVPWLFLKWSSHGIMFSCNNHQQQPMPEVQYGKGIGLTKAPENSDTHSLSAEEVNFLEKRTSCLITTKKTYHQKEYLLKVKGIPTLTVGDIHLIQSQAKQGKTTLVSIFVAAILAGRWAALEYALTRKAKVIIFDTEQFECDTFRQYRNMMRLGGMEEEDLERFSMYNLRALTYDERNAFIHASILREKPLMVVIDGIRDLISDINDPVKCPSLVQDLMNLATDCKCAILGVLHNNPGEGKARGWLGTEYINKCGYSFEPQKKDNIVTVKNIVYRGAPIPEWRFTFDSEGSPIIDEYFLDFIDQKNEERKAREAEVAQEIKEKEHLATVIDVLKEQNNMLTRSELVKQIADMKIEGFGRQKIYELIKTQLALPGAPFHEIDGKMVMAEHFVQNELNLF